MLFRAHPRVRAVRVAIGGVAAFAVCLLPLAAVQASHRRLGWVGGIELKDRVAEALQRLVTAGQPSSWAGATGAELTPYVWIGAVAVLSISVALLMTRGSPAERSGALLAMFVAGVGIGLPIAMAVVADLFTGGDGDYFLDRNVLGAWVPLATFLCGGLAARRAGILGAACLAAVVCWSLVVQVDTLTSPELQRDDWQSVASSLADEAVVVVYPAYQDAALRRQRPELVEQTRPETVDAIDLVLAGFEKPPATFRVPDGFSVMGVDDVQHFQIVRLRRDGPVEVRPSELARVPLDESDLAVLVRESG